MRKEEYLHKLEELLYSIPAVDRYEAIQFYTDYLEDAGTEAEEVIRLLGTPEELARSIQRDLYGDNPSGDYTRTYQDVPGSYKVPFPLSGKFSGGQGENMYHNQKNNKKTNKERKGRLTAGQWILFIILFCCAAPVIIPIFGGLLGVIIALLIAVIAVVCSTGVVGIALVIAAIAIIVIALVKVVISPLASIIMLGGSLVMGGFGIIGVVFALWICFKVLPKIFILVVDILSGIIHRK